MVQNGDSTVYFLKFDDRHLKYLGKLRRYRLPRHRVPFNSINHGEKQRLDDVVSKVWQALVEGKGVMRTYFVDGLAADAAEDGAAGGACRVLPEPYNPKP
jgi:hypothetical protein